MPNLTKEGWVDFNPLFQFVDGMYPRRPVDFLTRTLIAPKGEKVPFVVRRGNNIDIDIHGYPTCPIGFVQIGDLAIVDSRLKESMPDYLLEQYRGNIIWIWDGKSVFWEPTYLQYSSLAAYGLMSLDLTGKHVVDVGCADGVLSLVSKIRGAARVTSIDCNGDYEQFYLKHIDENGLNNQGLEFIRGNFDDPNVIQRLASDKVDIAVANIGPYSGEGHLDAVRLGAQIPGLHTYINGAFIKDATKKEGKYSPSPSIRLHNQLGFSTNYRELTYNTYCLAYMVDRDTNLGLLT